MRRWLTQVLTLALAFAAAGLLVYPTSISAGFALPVWPATGIAFAALLLGGVRLWPGIFLGTMIVGALLMVAQGKGPLVLLAFVPVGVVSAAEAALGVLLIRRVLGEELRLERAWQVVTFLLLAGPVAHLPGALLAPLTFLMSGVRGGLSLLVYSWTWWVGGCLGVVIVTPMALAVAGQPRARWRPYMRLIVLPMAVCGLLIVAAFLRAVSAEAAGRQLEAERRGALVMQALTTSVQGSIATVGSVWALIAASEEVTELEFSRFASQARARNRSVEILGWCAGEPGADGGPGPLWMEGGPVDLLPPPGGEWEGAEALRQENHGPCLLAPWLNPVSGVATSQGIVALSQPFRWRVDATTSTGVVVIMGDASDPGPNYAGLLGGLVDTEALIGGVLEELGETNLHVVVTDLDSGSLVFNTGGAEREGYLIGEHWQDQLELGGRTWVVDFCAHDKALAILGPAASVVLGAGLLSALLLATTVLLEAGRASAAARLVELRTLELRLARDQALVAAEAQGRFLAHVSHELRTPLSGVLGQLELLARAPQMKGQREAIQGIEHSARSLLDVINDVLDFSKLESGKLEVSLAPFELDLCIARVLALFAADAEGRGLDLSVRLKEDVPLVLVSDEARVQQILVNLIGNALKFTERGGVHVDARVAGDAKVRIEVWDSGVGVPPEDLPRLFQPFTQGAKARQGTGLGLSICKRLVTLLDGEIGVETTPGKGSCFWFTVATPLGELSMPPVSAAQGWRIAVVEPRSGSRAAIRTPLEAAGAEVVELGSLAEVATRVERGGRFAALVFSVTPRAERDALERIVREGIWTIGVASNPMRVQASEVVALAHVVVTWPVRRRELISVLSHAPAGEHPPVRRECVSCEGARVLIAEDDPVLREVLRLQLESLGVTPLVAGDGAQALRLAEEQELDLVLMDLRMPVMDGLEAARAIRASARVRAQPRIIAVTASVFPELRQRCLDAGMDGLTHKPLSGEQLCAIVQGTDVRSSRGAEVQEPQRRQAAIQGIRSLVADDERLLGLVQAFLDSAAGLVRDMRGALAAEDAATLARAAHTLKGSCAAFGCTALSARCATLEAESRAGALPVDAAARLDELSTLLSVVGPELLHLASASREAG